MGLFRSSSPPLPMAEPDRTLGPPARRPTQLDTHRGESEDGVRYTHHQPKMTPTRREKHALTRTPSVQTRYMNMLLAVDQIPRLHNIFASFFTWILLAGYIVFPATFTSIQKAEGLNSSNHTENAIKDAVLKTVKNVPLLWVAGACCILGGLGMLWLWYRWRENYVWLINRIFLPGLLNSIAGLISTLVNVYSAQHGVYSITAKITAIVTGACSGVFLILFVLYDSFALKRVKSRHQRELENDMTDEEKRESIMGKVKRKIHEAPLEPGSVI